MTQYRLKIQVVTWYELIVPAASRDEAVAKAETMRPAQIEARGTQVELETGLANPESVELIESS